jgi:eukaryotic-like serine/threonine-protein kinase
MTTATDRSDLMTMVEGAFRRAHAPDQGPPPSGTRARDSVSLPSDADSPPSDEDRSDVSSFASLPSLESLLREEQTELRPGAWLDRYEILCPVARGGMGNVWIARMRGKYGFEKLVALKTILADRSQEPRVKRMFLDEARIASHVDHVNVARILDLGEQSGLLYLTMEWVEGDSLSRLQRVVQGKGREVSPGVALRVVADACSGIQAVHDLRDHDGADLGVVHRDVSPQNILLGVDGVAKVIDFGIAKARHRLSGETSEGVLKGKLLYMAPEQAVGGEIDRRADVYSLGAVLYTLLAGKPPYQGTNDAATFGFLTCGLPPQKLPSHIPAPVAEVVLKALAPLEKRYATAAALRRAIEGAMLASSLSTEREEVSSYLRTHLGARIAARKGLIEQAIAVSKANEKPLERVGPDGPTPWETRHAPPANVPGPHPSWRRWLLRGAAPAALLVGGVLSTMVVERTRMGAVTPSDVSSASAHAAVAANPISDRPPPPEAAGPERSAPAPAPAVYVAAPAWSSSPPKHRLPPSPRRATSSECSPPYVLDSSGLRRYKRACFR